MDKKIPAVDKENYCGQKKLPAVDNRTSSMRGPGSSEHWLPPKKPQGGEDKYTFATVCLIKRSGNIQDRENL